MFNGHVQVDMQVFTQDFTRGRMNTRADASAVTPYFMLRSQLDAAVHVLANCIWLRPPTDS